ncbi:MAG TPA: glycogen synthase [Candidatus Mucispirillum faecigallinarum]|uniref:Glycogen synthase n=1 Tax=Candidatus Mucispirillum faecigallinarum TaxID=2838699 RepID=A0A9D2GWG0_9BACT|nr:glycogen synthase [Candidatus Mucispirillum faecigallinarum]
MNIVHITSEVLPFSYAGSMAETLFCLPYAEKRAGHQVTVLSPLYASVDTAKHNIKSLQLKTWVNAGFAVYEFELFETYLNDIRYVFFKNDDLFNRAGLYGMVKFDYADNDIRFGTFSQAALNFVKYHNIDADILHCHNWQTALVPVYKKLNYSDLSCKVVLTIHSVDNLGVFNKFTLEALNLPWEIYNIDNIEYYDNISFLKGGIVFADAITTLSPTFAKELINNGGGIGVEEIFYNHAHKLVGILNGICSMIWNPAEDTNIEKNFSADDISGKNVCKNALCSELGLDQNLPLVVFIQKMLPERGLDLVLNAAEEFADNDINLIIFGPNSSDYVNKIQEVKEKYNNIKIIFNDHANKSQKEYAAADIVIMPSLYEPCGSSLMIGMRYGAVPVARNTGGLVDGSKEAVEKGVGFTFDDFSVEAMMKAVKKAVALITSDKHDEVVKTLLQIDNSWQKASEKYIELYRKIIGG